MKKKYLSKRKRCILTAASAALLSSVILTGCTAKTTTVVDSEAAVVESSTDLTGTWVVPGKSYTLSFQADGTASESEKNSSNTGTYQFMSQNASFTIADRFEKVEYISCLDEDGKVFFSGAVLGDIISGYNEETELERYFVRQDRETVTAEEIIGAWEDVNGNKYYAVMNEDGTLKTTDWEGTYEIVETEDYGTSLIFHFEDYDETYAVIPYENYLFLYRESTNNLYQLKPQEEAAASASEAGASEADESKAASAQN